MYNLNFSQCFAFDAQKLRTCLKAEPFYGANEIGLERKTKSETRYIRITDIDDFGRLSNSLGATCLNIEDKYLLEYGDLLIARSGNTVGKSYLHDCKDNSVAYIFAGYLINFKIDKSKVSPKYVFYYLQSSFFQKWKNATMRLAGQPNINAQEYKNMLIPIPGSTVQQQIIDIMDAAYTEKQQKEKEAQELLDSINSYLLGELGVAIPLEEDNTLESRKFYANSADVLGGRFDPNYYNRQDVFNEAINQSKYDVISFKKLITDLSNGVEIREYSDSGFRYLRVTDMGKAGINNNSPRYVNVKDIPKKIKLSSNDLLISRSGSLGFVNIVEDSVINSILSSHIFRVSISLKCNPVYLQEYLRSYLGQFQFFKKNNGGIIPEINQEALKSILIVLPNQNKQQEITDKIEIIRSKARQLEQESNDAVKSAKAQVEKILLEGSL